MIYLFCIQIALRTAIRPLIVHAISGFLFLTAIA